MLDNLYISNEPKILPKISWTSSPLYMKWTITSKRSECL